MKTTAGKRLLSILLAVLMVAGVSAPGFSALAAETEGGSGIEIGDVIEIFYEDGTLVPEYEEDGETEFIQHLTEGDKVLFTYQLIDYVMPDNGYVKWTSDTPTVCDVTEDGIVRAFDSSKGAAVRLWIDNEVATIPLIGSVLKTVFEKALFNDTVNIDTMDTDAIIALVEAAFGSDSLLDQYIDSYKGELIDSLREYLEKVNTKITVSLYDGNDVLIDSDTMSVCVDKSQEPYADFIPNGTHITNKQDLPTTVAVGSTLQLSACTTPTRLHMGVIYSVKNSSIFSSGKVIATVDDTGLVTFKNPGEVTILVSPDTDGFIQNLLKYINYIYELGDFSSIDSSQVADILIKYVGLDINRTVLTAILDACFAISDIVGDSANAVQLTATAARVIANIIYQFTTNDSITFTVVEGVPVTDFQITGATTVREGTDIQLEIDGVEPEAADTSDITWSSSDPSIASVDPKTGVVTGRDAGGSLGQLSKQEVTITATSAANNVSKSVTITVTGRVGNYLSDVEVTADSSSLNLGQSQYMHAAVYPQRVAESDLLSFVWGVKTTNAETGEEEIIWASDPYQETDAEGNPLYDENGEPVMNSGVASNGIGSIDKDGLYTAVAGGNCTVVCKAQTGYELDGSYLEISSVQDEMDIDNGQPVTGLDISVTGSVGGSDVTVTEADINGEKSLYAVVQIKAGDANVTYTGKGVSLAVDIQPQDATNKNLVWYVDNENYELETSATGDTATLKMKAFVAEEAQSANIYCTSADGAVKSNTVTLTVSRNYATSNMIDGEELSVTNGKTLNVTHTMEFEGSLTGSNSATRDANWYAADPELVEIVSKDTSNGNAVIKGLDVGETTLYCVSTDGGIVDTAKVTVYPDKERLSEILHLCERAMLYRTEENAQYYAEYMRLLNYCYYVNENLVLVSQDVVNTYADDLLYVFYQLGGYVGFNEIRITDNTGAEAADYISVDVSSFLYKDTSYQLSYEIYPETAMYSNLRWESSSGDVAVDRSGRVTPTTDATACYATITVYADDYFGNTVSDSVVVAFSRTQATGITLDKTELSGKTGEGASLKAEVQPWLGLVSGADIKDVIWKSSDEGVATVDGDGNVKYVYGGECVIYAITADGGHTAECRVTVSTNYDALQNLINTYKNLNLQAENYYPDTYNALMSALDEAQAMVDAAASTQDEADAMYERLEAAYNGLKKYTFIQKVELYLDGEETDDYYQYDLSLFQDGISYKNAKLNLKVRLYPGNADYESVEWTTSTANISVTQDGVASPAIDDSCYGMVTCTVTDHFGNQYSDDVWVSFAYTPVTGISINESEIGGSIGGTFQLNSAVEPVGVLGIGAATIQDVFWQSDNEAVATVDQTGLVTFTGAGATTIRVTSYDGGYTAECRVSTEGDRTALNEAIEKYAGVNYMDYTYDYGMAFKQAYENAVAAVNDDTLLQSEIDEAAAALNAAGEALAGNEFIKASVIKLHFDDYKQNLVWNYGDPKQSGELEDSAAAHSFNSDEAGTGYKAKSVLTASVPAEAAANYPSISWSIVSSSGADVNINGAVAEVEQSSTTSPNARAELIVTATDTYGRTVTRNIRVVVSDNIVTGISLDQTNVERYANEGAFKLNATVTPDNAYAKDIIWRSSNTNIATVDGNGNVAPVNTGTAVITAETFDGGYKATCTVTFKTDYTQLAELCARYLEFYNSTKDTHTYTNASLANFKTAIDLAEKVVGEGVADQADVQIAIDTLNNAYNALEKFVAVTGVSLALVENENAVLANEGYVSYSATTLNGKQLQLSAVLEPANCTGADIEWSSSSDSITVDENGIVTKSGLSAGHAVITAKATDEAGNTAEGSIIVAFTLVRVSSVSFDTEMVYGAPGETAQLSPVFEPSLATYQHCTYVSSNPEIATVDDSGRVTFIKGGQCTITAYSVDGGYSASVTAYTTNDTSALKAKIAEVSSVNYMDYEYEYGMAFKTALETAQTVAADYAATQEAIDTACAELIEAYNALAEHPFIAPGELALKINGQNVEDNAAYIKDELTNQVVITASYAAGAMVKSAVLTYENAENLTAQVSGNVVTLTKDNDAEYGSITVRYTVTDDYDRVSEIVRTIKVTDKVQMIESFSFVYNGQEVQSVTHESNTMVDLRSASVQLSVKTYPEAAEAYTDIQWSSINSKVVVDQNGLVTVDIGIGDIATKTFTGTITCRITLSDGTVLSKDITVTFSRKY